MPPLHLPHVAHLKQPVVGLEAEFRVFVDERPVVPEDFWRTPQQFIATPLIPRSRKSSQLPTGGAVYFDGGVLELVTPVIEIEPACTARVVRNLWEQIEYVRAELDRWGSENGHRVRLEAFSCHVNVSFELSQDERSRTRTVQKLAVLLAHILPVPVLILGANRRSTGIGVRPRRDRIEITLDFTPDPGLMAATVAMIAGVVRDVIEWPSYLIEELVARGLPVLRELTPGKHPTRNGWIARAHHFAHDPFTTDPDEKRWPLLDGSTESLRGIARRVAIHFSRSIRAVADPFSVRLLFSLVSGDTNTLLDLEDRPEEYLDVGHATRWGSALESLEHFGALTDSGEHTPQRRTADAVRMAAPWSGNSVDRRATDASREEERRQQERRAASQEVEGPPLSRSLYEDVFVRAGSRTPLFIGNERLEPVRFRGWYHIEFRAEDGTEHQLSIDQILEHGRWA
jgi:hypothetical protein